MLLPASASNDVHMRILIAIVEESRPRVLASRVASGCSISCAKDGQVRPRTGCRAGSFRTAPSGPFRRSRCPLEEVLLGLSMAERDSIEEATMTEGAYEECRAVATDFSVGCTRRIA